MPPTPDAIPRGRVDLRARPISQHGRWLLLCALTTGCGASPSGSASAFCAGCAGADEPIRLIDRGVVASVSTRQKYLAFYGGSARLSTGAPAGPLSVMPLPEGEPTTVTAETAFGATFNRSGLALVYATGPTRSSDPDDPDPLGALGIWTPALQRGVTVTRGFAVLHAEPPDNAFTVAWDVPMPTKLATGDVVLVRAADCAADRCKPATLATGVTVDDIAISPDGAHAAYTVKSGFRAATTLTTYLVSVAHGTAVEVAETQSPAGIAPMAFSPDGALFAGVVSTRELDQQLRVISVATGAPVPWAAPPAGTRCNQLAFADGKTLLVRTEDDAGAREVHRLTATTQQRVASDVKFFALSASPSGASRYLFAATTASLGSTHDVVLYDLAEARPAPVPLAKNVPVFPALSDDLHEARFLEDVEPATHLGTLRVAGLPSGKVTTVSSNVAEVGGAAFAAGASKLLYIDAGASPAAGDGTRPGTLHEWNDGQDTTIADGVISFRTRRSPDVLYYAVAAGAGQPGIYQIALP